MNITTFNTPQILLCDGFSILFLLFLYVIVVNCQDYETSDEKDYEDYFGLDEDILDLPYLAPSEPDLPLMFFNFLVGQGGNIPNWCNRNHAMGAWMNFRKLRVICKERM